MQEVQVKMVETGRQLGIVKAQLSAREREKRVCDLTVKELASIPGTDVNAYRAVGKMFIQERLPTLISELEKRKSDSEREAKNFERAAAKLERDLKDTQDTWKEIMHRARPEQ
ncbi:Prefoldin [Fimicolochytrium jonesii]|uniref:Prefoldin n=1 Tax=Fimicolochytrium jonesii TaxID=1396493 RepID=UPI0022FDC602|nr:Prefoldin [Fimicolochytrium jonesii]KAI8815655.1 Prefoldin [Fimicolochytrium jonesii]